MSSSLPFVYEAVPKDSIRVLELQGGQGDDALICRLVVQRIADIPYEAISYVWGDPTKDVPIICNQKCLGITTNLSEALIAFRLRDSVRRIWADAICINQDDIPEREAQLAVMGAIYTNAQQVLCFLGPDPGTAALAIDFLRNFNQDPDGCIRSARILQELDVSKYRRVNTNPEWQAWGAIKVLFDLQFFHRVWIIQELGLAKNAQLQYGNHSVVWPEVTQFVFTMDNEAAFLINHLQLKSWIVNHTNLIWQMSNDGKPVYSFVDVLNWARVHQSTDPKDRIYGFLGHPSATIDGSLIVQPDYCKSVAEAYVELAVESVRKTKTLRVLSAVDHDEESIVGPLPSWVPDWHVDNCCALLLTPTAAAPKIDDLASVIHTGENAVLNARGVALDNVAAWSSILDQNEFMITSLENEMRKKTPFLLDHLWEMLIATSGIKYDSQQLLDSISLTLIGGYGVGSHITKNMRQHRADFAAYIYEFERLRPDSQGGSFLSSFPPEVRASLQTSAVEGSAAQIIQNMTWNCMARRVFRTANGYIGIGPRIMKKADVCCVLFGSEFPMLLREVEASDGYYLVGEAIIQGFMNGEALEMAEEGKLKLQEFPIF